MPRLARSRGLRLGDFTLRGGRVVLRKTGNSAAIDRALLTEVAIWVTFYLALRLRAAWAAVRLRAKGKRFVRRAIWFTPDVPHPRYMIRIAAIAAGFRVARTPGEAVAAFFFDDATQSVPPLPSHAVALNFGCGDITKSRVARVFAEVFDYPLAIDPMRWSGPAVAKSEANGAHDGHIVQCPCEPKQGYVYQRLVDTVRADGFAYDLRTHVIGGTVAAVWIKRRSAAGRFQPANLAVTRHDPAAIFSRGELKLIGAFARAMGADWAGLDILRDVHDGRIYIVDVNKTDAGPIIALPLRDKLASALLLGAALRRLIAQRGESGTGSINVRADPSSIAANASIRASKAA